MSTPPLDLNRSTSYSLICLFILVFFPRNVFSQEILLNASTDGTMVQACEGEFKDSGLGASDGHYDILEDYTITLCPENPGEKLNIDFEEFFLGNSGESKMYLYDGDSEAADPITIFPKPRTANYFSKNEFSKLTNFSFP